MSNDAARLEALGADRVEFYWRGRPLTIPLSVEEWPLETLRAGRNLIAVELLLNGQSLGRLDPLIDDYRDLSEAMAEACGVGRLPEKQPEPHEWFGGVPRLLQYLRDYEAEVESDLRSRWGLDYADRWRIVDGRPALTLRRIWSCIRRSLPTSALAVADNYGREVWTEQTFATARVWEALTGKPYEGRPFTEAEYKRAIEAMQRQQARIDKLRARRAAYHPTPEETPPAPANAATAGVLAAAQQAMANRRREIGASEVNGNTLN